MDVRLATSGYDYVSKTVVCQFAAFPTLSVEHCALLWKWVSVLVFTLCGSPVFARFEDQESTRGALKIHTDRRQLMDSQTRVGSRRDKAQVIVWPSNPCQRPAPQGSRDLPWQ